MNLWVDLMEREETITGGSCHKYYFCRDKFCRSKHTFVVTKDMFCRDKTDTCGSSGKIISSEIYALPPLPVSHIPIGIIILSLEYPS